MGAVTANFHVRATVTFDPIFYICQPILAKFGIKYFHVNDNNDEGWFSEIPTVINDENDIFFRIL
jgi:hypothetical protein